MDIVTIEATMITNYKLSKQKGKYWSKKKISTANGFNKIKLYLRVGRVFWIVMP
jgi:hypothetical protein